jgi:ketosteroid isomerase-like protein
MKTPALQVIACLSVLACGCAHRADLRSERQALLTTDKQWAAAAAAGIPERILSFYAEDAVNYFPGFPPAEGKAAIAEVVRRNRSLAGFSLHWEPVEAVVSTGADIGYTTGPFTLAMEQPGGSPVKRTGHYVCIWRKAADGTWKCIVESTIFEGPTKQSTE